MCLGYVGVVDCSLWEFKPRLGTMCGTEDDGFIAAVGTINNGLPGLLWDIPGDPSWLPGFAWAGGTTLTFGIDAIRLLSGLELSVMLEQEAECDHCLVSRL